MTDRRIEPARPMIRRHETLARVLLYGSPILLFLVLSYLISKDIDLGIDTSWSEQDYLELEAVALLQEYLRFDTSYPDGNEIPAAEWLAKILRAEGAEVHVERLGSRNANLWATLPGKDPRPLVLHNHIDVEPVLRLDKWQHPPFSGAIDGPFIYGRGAFDMKSIAIAQLIAFLEAARSGETPARSLMFLATGDEERDSFMGTRRLLPTRPSWHEKDSPSRFWAVITEGGAVEARSLEEIKYWGTEFAQKRFVDVWVCAQDPEPLQELRQRLHRHKLDWRMTSPAATFLPHYAPSRDRPEGRELLAMPETLIDRLKAWPVDVGPTVLTPYVEALLTSSVVAFPVEPAPGGGFRVRLILHLLPDVPLEDVWQALVADELRGFEYQVVEPHPPVEASSLEHPLFVALDAFMAERYPEHDHGPLFIPFSATDARYFRQYEIPTFGFMPFQILAVDAQRMKGANERIPIPAVVVGAELYADFVDSLLFP